MTSDGAAPERSSQGRCFRSADGRLVYFVRNHQDLYAVAATGGDPWPITRYRSFSTALEYPAATADGGSVLFTRVDKAGDVFVLHMTERREP